MRDVSARAARAGKLRAGVMVRGESGTGRRVVARAIHAHQPKPARFVAVDCAAFDCRRARAGAVRRLGRRSAAAIPTRWRAISSR